MNPSHDKDYADAYDWGNDGNDSAIRKVKQNCWDQNNEASASADPSKALGLILRGKVSAIHRNDVIARSLHDEKHLISYGENHISIDSTEKGHTQHTNSDDEEEDTWCDIVHYDGSHFDALPHDQNSIAHSRRTNAVQLTKPAPQQTLLGINDTDALPLDQNIITQCCRINAVQTTKSVPQQVLLDRYDARNLLDEYHTINHAINNNDSLARLQMYLNDQKSGKKTHNQEVELNLERYGCLKEYWHVFCDSSDDTEDPTSAMTGALCLAHESEETNDEKNKLFGNASDNKMNTEDSEFEMMDEHEKMLLPIGMVLVRIR